MDETLKRSSKTVFIYRAFELNSSVERFALDIYLTCSYISTIYLSVKVKYIFERELSCSFFKASKKTKYSQKIKPIFQDT